MSTAIEIRDLTVKYGENKILSGFSHSFEKGSHTAIMGASGSGKTSLINAVMGIVPYEGSINTGDSVISAVFQEDRLCDGLNVYKNIRLVSDRKFHQDDIKKILSEVDLEGTMRKRVCDLSGGMKRRVAIIRALLAPHNVLILDEPFKGLDDDTKSDVMNYIRKNTSDTMILVTHDISEAQFFGAEIISLSGVTHIE